MSGRLTCVGNDGQLAEIVVRRARIAIKVIDGEGRITAYGSVIDMQTQDPTYVPAQ